MDIKRRSLVGALVLGSSCQIWTKPVVNSVLLPAHAQTSSCMVDSVVGGPLVGNPAQANTCQAACEFVAEQQDAQLCMVETFEPATGAECSCSLDLPGS